MPQGPSFGLAHLDTMEQRLNERIDEIMDEFHRQEQLYLFLIESVVTFLARKLIFQERKNQKKISSSTQTRTSWGTYCDIGGGGGACACVEGLWWHMSSLTKKPLYILGHPL
ncbi:hypothetical protein Lal_00042176 [Lupinus albus]|nr:hypothetical protein Lal_00042176 [Lupinus albus]